MTGNFTSPGTKSTDFQEAFERAAGLLASDPSETLTQANRLAAERPEPRVFRLAAAAYRALDREDEAAAAELQAIKFGFVPELRQAVAARESGRLGNSKAIVDEYLNRHPDDLLAMAIAAEAATGLGQEQHAEDMLRQVLVRAPAFPRAAILLANLLSSQARLRNAIIVIENLREQLPQDQATLRFLANLRAQAGDYSEAASLYGQVIASAPDNHDDLFKRALNLRAAGSREESIAMLRQAIALSPEGGAAWWALAQYFPDALEDADLEQMQSALIGATASDAGLMRIALSIIHDRRGEREAAFGEISAVKVSRRPVPPYDPDILSQHVDELIAEFTPELFSSRQSDGANSTTLVFIVGMPRSGSTLVERILGRHSKIEGMGELQVLPRLVAAGPEGMKSGFYSLLPSALPTGRLTEMAGLYLERSRDFRRTDKLIFIDKYNANWIHTGLIRLMFPHARILDVRRNALDCCWSVFKMMFGDAYANDQRHLARYFVDYARFMKAVQDADPDGILTVSYESLVNDVEGEARRILDFIGVDYEPQCATFHLSDQPVATPSSEQVRRPLFREGIGSAEPYRKWLGPLIDELEARSTQLDD